MPEPAKSRKKSVAIIEMTFEQFAKGKRLASTTFGEFQPAVYKKLHGGYSVRVLASQSWHSNYITTSWEYFELDKHGLIYRSPRGLAKKYNNKVCIIDIDQAVEEYKDKVC
jgi:hypothetical protein